MTLVQNCVYRHRQKHAHAVCFFWTKNAKKQTEGQQTGSALVRKKGKEEAEVKRGWVTMQCP